MQYLTQSLKKKKRTKGWCNRCFISLSHHPLGQGLANLLCNGPDNKYFRLYVWGISSLSQLLNAASGVKAATDAIKEWVWLCSSKTPISQNSQWAEFGTCTTVCQLLLFSMLGYNCWVMMKWFLGWWNSKFQNTGKVRFMRISYLRKGSNGPVKSLIRKSRKILILADS